MIKIIRAALLFPLAAVAQDIALPDADGVPTSGEQVQVEAKQAEAQVVESPTAASPAEAPGAVSAEASVQPAVPFTMTAPQEDGDTLRVVEKLQARRALLEAQAEVESARARLKASECEANRGCLSGAAPVSSMASINPPPATVMRREADVSAPSMFTIGGIYKRGAAPATADLFVNGGRVSVEEGSQLPGGYKVASITSAGVSVQGASGKKIQLTFAQRVDANGR